MAANLTTRTRSHQPRPSQFQGLLLFPSPSLPSTTTPSRASSSHLAASVATCMNSLSYLSRQFDAYSRTPPSTPVHSRTPTIYNPDADSSGSLKRVQTWSTKSFLIDPSGSPGPSSTLKRSYSSPAKVHPDDPAVPSTSSVPQPRRPSVAILARPPSRRPSVSPTEKAIRPKPYTESLFRRIFFVRVLLSLWQCMYNLWKSVTGRVAQQGVHEVAAEEASDDDEKDTEDEGNEKPVTLDVQQSPPIPPPLSSSSASPFQIYRSSADSTVPLLELKSPSTEQHADSLSAVALPRVGEQSRTPTPSLATRKTALHLKPKTLVLDLDETLIHSTSRPMYSSMPGSGLLGGFGIGRRNKSAGHMVEVVLGGRSTLYHVYKRPFVDYFLRKVSAWYTLVIFTASMQEYADPVIDWLDAGRGILGRRFFRELSGLTECIIANGIPIEGWTNDPHDEALLDLLPILDSLRFTSDVRRVLGIRGFS
ncbi:hypothetical protein PHLCEN_2v9351 [Hermanssonia centrifuga]|uniref:Mitochondrial import inner membrane translocase subunit TIM50 n=1 Tax=Hermanssonia centrifuga TaxID=98765 RepID=A0A2R6NR02_9APHY|nr:hypothetical protein PHLCEN_2v9351 [Hermanssonia centrifuga]